MKDITDGYKKWSYAILGILALVAYYVSNFPLFESWAKYRPFVQKFIVAFFLILVILLIAKIMEKVIQEHGTTEGNKHNLIRVTRLVSWICMLVVLVSFLFQNFYAAAAGLGIVSLVLGFALQEPISSFIAWLYIVFRKPYAVGDRIQLSGRRGDVAEIHYLDTTIIECGGDYVADDHQSGRRIHIPNSAVLGGEIINYSGSLTPFIWDETAIQTSYTSDFAFVEDCLLAAAEEDFNEHYPQFAQQQHQKWKHSVYLRSNSDGWMESVISYPVEPLDITGRRNRIFRKTLPKLNAQPGRVKFPEDL